MAEADQRGASAEALRPLLAIDSLEVGPLELTPRRISCPYRVTVGGREQVNELIYSYPEAAFDPHQAAHRNLAAMIALQPALNYGLFCRRLVMHGPLDRVDRRFIKDMASNTAREIYVTKILGPNPFLTDAARDMPAVKLTGYLQAELEFPEAVERPLSLTWEHQGRSCAVLSSGGKESLLSYGLLAEIGQQVHPIFINESGRHWFTALNAHRYFSEQVPGTARIWTNADRLFNWMLRQLPLVRPDFSKLRADIYPIRLWTVAVFLFGALPLLMKRKVGRLVVGDEYDTTSRSSYKGITHYGGLFDQSIYFDRALSRYYQRKGWVLSQFSVLRTLSEMLIEKILVERYPELQRHQVSCHAAHKENGGVHPCGHCEKCRRVVGMLAALGADPSPCGYRAEQVARCLKDWREAEVHQEESLAAHTRWLLTRRGLIGEGAGRSKARPHPEVLKLRVDPERSPLEAIPRDLRRPLYGIFLEHAQGAVRRSGRVWVDFELVDAPELDRPYDFESAASNGSRPLPAGSAAGALPEHDYILGELTWPQAEARFKEVDLVLLPVGAIEQHGPHLPLDTDAFDARHLALEVARSCSAPRPLVLPLIPYGVSYHHQDFPGTLGVSPDALSHLVCEVGMAAALHGATKLVIINGHGGNVPALSYAAQMINRDAHIFTCVESGETSDADVDAMTETPNDVHAGESETSTSLAVRPELVRMEAAWPSVPHFSSRYLDFTNKRSVAWYAHTMKLSSSGVLGDPTKASAEKGRRIWEVMVRRLVEFVEHLKGLTLEEIYQRRY
jgi:creatinine amidohydrolase/Fe(II)-dependent formamide hydrolase-like protein